MQPIAGFDADVLEWARYQEGSDGGAWHPDLTKTIGIVNREGALCGAAIFSNYTGHDIELTGVGRYVFSRSVCQAVCRYVFLQLRCSRMTVMIRASRTRLRRICERHGFKAEGLVRRRYGDEDAIIMGMLPEDCRWLTQEERRNHGKPIASPRPGANGTGAIAEQH